MFTQGVWRCLLADVVIGNTPLFFSARGIVANLCAHKKKELVEMNVEDAKQKIVAFICKVGLPVKDQGAEGRPYHGLYHCDQKPLDVILRLYEDGSVRLYCQSLFPLGQPKFDEWFGSVAFMRIKEALALVGELSSLRLKNGKGKEKRQVMDVKIKDVDWRKSLGEDELQRIGNGYRCLLVALIAAQVFNWNVNRR